MSVVLTKSRCINALRCYFNYALSRFGLVRISHAPLFVSVEPAAVCQLRCPECPVGRGKGKERKEIGERFMSIDLFRQVLREASAHAWTFQFYFQGEPLLNSGLATMIREAHEAGVYTIVSTNAQAMTAAVAEDLVRAGLDRIIVSMDGLTEESYNAYRIGGSIETCRSALRFLREAKQRLKAHIVIEIQCLLLKSNEHEWPLFKKQYKTMGADRLVFKTAQLCDYANGHPLMPSSPRYSRYTKGADGLYHRRPRRAGCLRVWSGVVVAANGDVLPCCYDKDRTFRYGNINLTPLKDLFRSSRAMAFRRAALKEQPTICKECWR